MKATEIKSSLNKFGLQSVSDLEAILQYAFAQRAQEMKTQMDEAAQGKRNEKKHSHYFKDVSHLNLVDVYRVLKLFNVTDPCLQHAIKKLLVAGGRGDKAVVSTYERDLNEAIDSIARALEMINEDTLNREEK